jgi:translation elongation factor EF-G
VSLAFKLEESRFGQLTYIRIYQGKTESHFDERKLTIGEMSRFVEERNDDYKCFEQEKSESPSTGIYTLVSVRVSSRIRLLCHGIVITSSYLKVRMHSNEMEDVESAGAGDVVAVFGVECASMDTFTDGSVNYSMVSMFVPKPVMSIAVKPKDNAKGHQIYKSCYFLTALLSVLLVGDDLQVDYVETP